MRTLIVLILVASTIAANTLACAARSLTLSSGKTIEILAFAPLVFVGGKQRVLMLKYQTSTDITNLTGLRQEADEIWDRMQIDAESGGYTSGVISATSPASTDPVAETKSYNFIYEKEYGRWHSIPETACKALTQTLATDFMAKTDFYFSYNEMNAMILYFADDWTERYKDLTAAGNDSTFTPLQFAQLLHDKLGTTTQYNHTRHISSVKIAADRQSAVVSSVETESGIERGVAYSEKELTTDALVIKSGSILDSKTVTTTIAYKHG